MPNEPLRPPNERQSVANEPGDRDELISYICGTASGSKSLRPILLFRSLQQNFSGFPQRGFSGRQQNGG